MATVADIAAWLGVAEDKLDAPQCEQAIAAVDAHLAQICDVPDPMVDDFELGAIMLVARLRKRGESPVGTIGFDGTSIAGFDADISRLLAAYEKREGRFG